MAECKKVKVIYNIKIAKGVFKLAVNAGNLEEVKAGQFYMLRCWDMEPVLGRPISVCEVKDNELIFLYLVMGRGTEMLSKLEENNTIEIMGPLGNGFDLDIATGRVALVCGGIGIAPMVELSKRIKASRVDVYSGFRSDVYGVEEIKPYVNSINISTEDGSIGHKGYITEIFNPSEYDLVLCCGPEVMMHKVLTMCKSVGVKVYVSTEKHMACGVGACLVCTCKTMTGNKRSCKEGPVFDGEELVLD